MSGGSKVQTTRSEPWEAQKPYLEEGFKKSQELYDLGQMSPSYFTGPTLAGFDPAQTAAQTSALSYATGPRPANLQAGAETTGMGGMAYGLGAMGYGAGLAGPLTTAEYAGLTPFSEPQYAQLLSGEVDPTTFDPLAAAYRSQAMNQLTGEVLPGIRTAITQNQAGGGTRGDILQANAVAAAQKQISDNLAQAEFGAYQQAQDRQLAAAQMGLGAQQAGMGYGMQGAGAASQAVGQYPSIMGAPLQMFDVMSNVGQQRQAMEQAGMDRAMQQYEYEAQLPTLGLQNYLAGISGEYGGTNTAVGPGGPSPVLGIMASLAGGALGGPAGAMGARSLYSALT
tara:strand:- start:1686 stop:2702 length:1017 start_codon:yes stop_codon:yes gene_type:complete